MSRHRIVSKDQWLEERKAFLAREKAMTKQLDALRQARRDLPWVWVETPYVFDTPDGKRTLAELFGSRDQLAVYHFMLTPGSDHICPGCSFIADHIDAARQHFEQAGLSFCAISRAPLAQIEPVKRRMGWTFPWASSFGSRFNYDFGVSFTPEDMAAGRASYNYGSQTIEDSEDMHGTSIFAKDEAGAVYHTYSTYGRGAELLDGAFMWLDLTPKGRNEADGIMSWVQLHDEYPQAAAKTAGCCH
ncbi:MAG: thioredoxin family protein [Hyphomicrobiaceae bacterium]